MGNLEYSLKSTEEVLEVALNQLSQEQTRRTGEDNKAIELELHLGDTEYKLEFANRNFDQDPRCIKGDCLGLGRGDHEADHWDRIVTTPPATSWRKG